MISFCYYRIITCLNSLEKETKNYLQLTVKNYTTYNCIRLSVHYHETATDNRIASQFYHRMYYAISCLLTLEFLVYVMHVNFARSLGCNDILKATVDCAGKAQVKSNFVFSQILQALSSKLMYSILHYIPIGKGKKPHQSTHPPSHLIVMAHSWCGFSQYNKSIGSEAMVKCRKRGKMVSW